MIVPTYKPMTQVMKKARSKFKANFVYNHQFKGSLYETLSLTKQLIHFNTPIFPM